jgi:hypothetical protein
MCLFFQCYPEIIKRTALFNGSQTSPALPSEKKNGIQMQIDKQHLSNDNWRGELKNSKRILSQLHFIYHKRHVAVLGSKHNLCIEGEVTNCLNHDTTWSLKLVWIIFKNPFRAAVTLRVGGRFPNFIDRTLSYNSEKFWWFNDNLICQQQRAYTFYRRVEILLRSCWKTGQR